MTFADWLGSLDLNELRDFRFELYDRFEIAPKGSHVAEFARAVVPVVCLYERRLEAREELRGILAAAVPDVDSDVIIDALVELSAARRELDSGTVAGTFTAALEVAQRRAEHGNGSGEGNE